MNPCQIPPLVLFDLDGTLVDTAPDLHAAMNRMLDDAGRAPVALEGFRRVVSRGGLAMLGHAFPDLTETEHAALLAPYLDLYGRETTRLSRPFDGVEPLLAAIEASGARWGIVTNKPGWLSVRVVEGLGWSERCAVLVAGDTLPVKKPDPAPLLHACTQLAIDAGQCVYIGDDARDIQAARAAGMRSIAALWGYRSVHDDPAEWGSDVLVETPHGLLTAGVLVCA